MESAVLGVTDVLILAGSTVYTVTVLCSVSAMWTLRKQFFIALRSPLLGCLIGATHTVRSCSGVYYFALWSSWSSAGEVATISASLSIILTPASLVALTATIAWVVRLLVLYDPTKRKKWGRHTNEKRIFRGLIWTYVLIEVAAWTSVGVIGLQRTASMVFVLDGVGTLATLAAAALLTGKLRKIHDICRLSIDTQRIGAIMVFTIVAMTLAFSVPMPRLLQKYVMIAVSISPQPMAFIINIRPVRDYLQRHDHPDVRAGSVLLLLLQPWAWLWRLVTCEKDYGPTNSYGSVACIATDDPDHQSWTARSEFRSSGFEHLHGSKMATVMEFLPLKQAFQEYCRKALCSESFQFLVDVSEFQAVVQATRGAGDAGGNDDFDEFTAIVIEYIKDGSHSEINIDSSTKKKILGFCERSVYSSLVLDDRKNIFLLAEKEIAKMLADNLLNKFKATKEYKELVGDTLLEEEK